MQLWRLCSWFFARQATARLRSGQALTPRITQDRSQTFSLTDRPDLIGEWKKENPGPLGLVRPRRIPTPCAADFRQRRYGCAGRTEFQSAGLLTRQELQAGRIKTLEFRAEFFNFTNHPNFARPELAYDNANFGVVTQALESRQIQFSLKFVF